MISSIMYLSIRGTVVFLFFLTPNSDPAMMILSTSHPEVDVLIVGAGPAGLLCADALAVANVTVRIVDKRLAIEFILNICAH